MTPFQQFVTHLVAVIAVVCVVIVLAVKGLITGSMALAFISAVGITSIGVGAASVVAGSASPAPNPSGNQSGTGAAPIP